MNTTINKTIDDWCKREALGQTLSSWDDDESPDGNYDAVVDELEELGDTWVESDTIVVWQPFEYEYARFVADQIDSLYNSYRSCAEFVLANKEGN
jgi:hypothetical protein